MSNIHQRFHVGCDTCGFVAGVASFNAACREADCHDHGPMVSVFDSMARIGKWEHWEQTQDGWEPTAIRQSDAA